MSEAVVIHGDYVYRYDRESGQVMRAELNNFSRIELKDCPKEVLIAFVEMLINKE